MDLFMISVLYWEGGKEGGGKKRKKGNKREKIRSNDLHIPAVKLNFLFIQ